MTNALAIAVLVIITVYEAMSIGYYTIGGHHHPNKPWAFGLFSILFEIAAAWLAINVL